MAKLEEYVRSQLAKDGYVVIDNIIGADFGQLRDEIETEANMYPNDLPQASNYPSFWSFRKHQNICKFFHIAYNSDKERMLSCR